MLFLPSGGPFISRGARQLGSCLAFSDNVAQALVSPRVRGGRTRGPKGHDRGPRVPRPPGAKPGHKPKFTQLALPDAFRATVVRALEDWERRERVKAGGPPFQAHRARASPAVQSDLLVYVVWGKLSAVF